MKIGFSLPSVGPAPDREFIIDVARAAEDLGFDSVWTSDHIIFPVDRKSEYPYQTSTTELAFSPGIQWLDPVAVMGVVAGVTERVEIGTSVLILPYRNPVVLANEISSLDRLSEGRILLGVGVGWMDEEFDAVGVPKNERGARTDEYIALLRRVWGGRPTAFKGRFYEFGEMELAAHPRRVGGPPILIGGNTDPALRRTARLADGWLGFEVFPEDVQVCIDKLQVECDSAGRSISDLSLSVRRGLLPPFEVSNFLPHRRCLAGSPQDVADEIKRYADAGISSLTFDVSTLPFEMIDTMKWFADEVVGKY